MTADAFADRVAQVRVRFVSTLEGKIDGVYASIPKLAESEPRGAALDESYRSIHTIVGVAPTIGFPAIGAAAHDVEAVLRPAQDNHRGLTEDEIAELDKRLGALREIAKRELRFSKAV
jgi:chemotaxis protein histidine kinase CheA